MKIEPLSGVLRHLQGESARAFPPDEELLKHFVASGSEEAFAALVQRHGPSVLRVCRQTLADTHDAEDAFQATFLVLVRKAARIGRRECLNGWLYGVAQRVSARLRAQRCRRREREHLVSDVEAAGAAPEQGVYELWNLLHEEVLRLPLKYRLPVILCYLEGRTHEAAAQELGWPKGTVSGRLARARDLLHRRLTRRGLLVPSGGVAVFLWAGSAGATMPPALLHATLDAAKSFAAGAWLAPSLSSLTHGVLKTMFFAKLKTVAALGLPILAVLALLTGLAIAHPSEEPALATSQVRQESAQEQDPPRKPPVALPKKKADPPAEVAKDDPDPEEPKTDGDRGPKERQTINTGNNGVFIVAMSPDNRTIFLTSGSTVEAWSIETGKRRHSVEWYIGDTLRGRPVLSPDGKRLVTALPGRGVRVWDVENREDIFTFKWPGPKVDPDTGEASGPSPVIHAAVSANAERVATWLQNGSITIWDVSNGKQLRNFKPSGGPFDPQILALSPDGKMVAGVQRGVPRLWDAETGKEKPALKTPAEAENSADDVRFSADGKRIMLLGRSTVQVWDVAEGKLRGRVASGAMWGSAVSLSPDGKMIAVAVRDKPVRVVEVATGKELARYHWVSSPGEVLFSPDGSQVASVREGRVRVWPVRGDASESSPDSPDTDRKPADSDPSRGEEPRKKKPKPEETEDDKGPKELKTIDTGAPGIRLLGISPDRKMLYLGWGRSVQAWDIGTGKKEAEIDLGIVYLAHIVRPAIAPDGKAMAFAGQGDGIHVLDLQKQELKQVVTWPRRKVDPDTGESSGPPGVVAVAVGVDARHAASCTADGKITIWNLATGKARDSFSLGKRTPRVMALSPGGKLLALILDGKPRIWDVAEGKEKVALPVTGDLLRMEQMQFTPNGKVFYLQESHRVHLWNADDGKPIGTVNTPTLGRGHGLTVFPDGKRVAVAPYNAKLYVTDTASGREVVRYHWVSSGQNDVIVSPDGTLMASVRDGRVRLWEVNPKGD